MALEPLRDFNLVGGTALALLCGHRISIDLDLFSKNTFNSEELIMAIESFAKEENIDLVWELVEGYTLSGKLNDIKVDIIRYPYELIDDIIIDQDIRLLSTKDIAPMKLSAIAQRGGKKDFFDFYELLNSYSLDEMLVFFGEKFPHNDYTYVLRSLTYFEDAELQKDPIMIKNYGWEQVKKTTSQVVKRYINDKL